MLLKKIKKLFLSFMLTLLVYPQLVFAYSDYIIAGGQNIGIEVKSKGAMIVGTYKVNEYYPASEAGLNVGDVIVSLNDSNVSSADDIIGKMSDISGDTIKIGYIRNNKLKYTNLKLYKTNEGIKTGIYLKDKISGVGTLTYIDPNSKLFGALGHEIIESNSGNLFNSNNGTIFSSYVVDINRSSNGSPGEKIANYDINDIYGNILENTNKGVFGKYTSTITDNNVYKVGLPEDVKKGRAIIRTVIKDDVVENFEINIDNIDTQKDIKNISFTITDKDLIQSTGGVIQGMSGSPIIQNDKIIGAITHMVIEKPTKGYGIFITNMLTEAEN